MFDPDDLDDETAHGVLVLLQVLIQHRARIDRHLVHFRAVRQLQVVVLGLPPTSVEGVQYLPAPSDDFRLVLKRHLVIREEHHAEAVASKSRVRRAAEHLFRFAVKADDDARQFQVDRVDVALTADAAAKPVELQPLQDRHAAADDPFQQGRRHDAPRFFRISFAACSATISTISASSDSL